MNVRNDPPEDGFADSAERPLLLHLPGLGCPAEDFAVPAGRHLPAFRVAGIDLPGSVSRDAPDFAADLPTLAEMVRTFCRAARIERFVLVGHSAGGALATLVADLMPDSVACLVNIEGNLHPDDCFLSRRIAATAEADAERLVRETLPAELQALGGAGSRKHAKRLAKCPNPAVLRELSASLVALTDDGSLAAAWARLACPKIYLAGVDSPESPALAGLKSRGDRVEHVPGGHFPHLDRPREFFRRLGDLLAPLLD